MERDNYVRRRRKFYRLDVALPVDVEIINRSGGEIPYLEMSRGFTKNISGGGIFLETPAFEGELLNDLLFKEKLLKLTIHLPNSTPIKVLGRAIWAEGLEDEKRRNHGLGMEFIWITKKQRGQIISYISKAKRLK